MYASYIDTCIKHNVKTINSANFGRLVRLVYPDVKTRRLGVRGESKYHYCGVRYKGDTSAERTANQDSVRRNKSLLANANDVFGGGLMSTNSLMRNLQRDMQQQSVKGVPATALSGMDFSSFIRPTTRLIFPTAELSAELDEQVAFELPQIYDYLPDDADADVHEALVAAYYMHCVNLIEAVASMKVRQFMQLNSTFYHALTPEVQQLLQAPSLATWIQKADLQTYQHIARVLSPLTTQVVPPEVYAVLKNLSLTLLPSIHQSIVHHAPHLLQAKLVPAGHFVSLLSRMLRVNETAHAAARFLTNSADRELMRMDWMRYVDAKQIANRELACGEEEVVHILNEVLTLLGPTRPPADKTAGARGSRGAQGSSPTPHSTGTPQANGTSRLDSANAHDDAAGANDGTSTAPGQMSSHEPVLDQWQRFLESLPHRFPAIEPRLFLLCMGAVESSVLREVTVSGGEGFGALWVVRCWVDEMMRWLCEKGGFLLEQVHDTFADDDDEDVDLDDFFFGRMGEDAGLGANTAAAAAGMGLSVGANGVMNFPMAMNGNVAGAGLMGYGSMDVLGSLAQPASTVGAAGQMPGLNLHGATPYL